MINLSVLPYKTNNDNVYFPNFSGRTPSSAPNLKKNPIFRTNIKTPKNRDPGPLYGVSSFMREKLAGLANIRGICMDDLLREQFRHLSFIPQIIPEASKSANIGRTKVTTLIDGGQIFEKTIEHIQSAKNSIQVAMFEFQNLKVDGHKWPTNGADVVPGFNEQQAILPMLISKKRENPNLKIQVILDAHKWYINGNGEKERHYNNMDMIKYLKENDIDVVPFPRAAQQGAALQHVKLLVVDGKKAIVGGMNWGTHSCANHDACVAVETLPKHKNSEVDNVVSELFTPMWKFSWQRLGKTKLVSGPLTEAEQSLYTGIRKEIKPENVAFMEVVGKLFDNPKDLNRYDEGRLDIIPSNPLADPAIKVLVTRPKEFELVGEEGKESTRKYILDKVKTAKKLRGELFVLSDKEVVETIVERHKKGELDAQIIVSPDILKDFAYCRNAYDSLIENGVPVKMFNVDDRIKQRMHAKLAVFNDRELVIGSTNWSAMGFNQNLKKGMREDYEKHSGKIDQQVKGFMESVKEHEQLIGFPPISESPLTYEQLMERRKTTQKAWLALKKDGVASININGKECNFTEEHKSTIRTVLGYYNNIKDRINAKEKYKRGNNECAIAFESPSLTKVFLKQFEKDWKHSLLKYDELKDKALGGIRKTAGNSLNYEG